MLWVFFIMKKKNILREQTRNKLFEKSGISMTTGTNLIVVDIQPEYADYINFNLYSFYEELNDSFHNLSSLTFLYNGAETLDMVSETDFKYWLMEQGLNEDVIMNSHFYDKGYAFFRYCMDSGIDDEDVANFVKFMIKYDINDSRDMTEEKWSLFMREHDVDQSDVRDLLEHSDDMINIPDLMDFLERYGNITLCGGGINECLKEVEIALMAMDKPYKLLTKYIY